MSNSSGSSSTPRIQVFRPTMDEFKNFSKYIEKIESTGAHKAGLAKIIPPEGWCPRKKGYDDIELIIPAPISQVVTGRQGLYQQINIQQKAMTVKEFRKLAESSKYKTPAHFDYEDLERKYWKNITYNSPIYGADVSGSLYDQGVNEFNIQHLNTILDMVKEDYEIQIEGVNTAYLYFGMWKTTFAWHTEDMDLYSINYLHFGAPKSWYVVPPEHGRRLERLANGFFHGSAQSCPAFLRHKMTIISPHILKQYSIPCSKITQEPGEFMITFPFGYHSGFNHGFNCAESTNFALERWIEYGKRTISCTCRNDCVKICMDVFVRKFQPERYELWKAGKDIGIHPEEPTRHYAAPPPRKFELALAQQREEKKKKMAQKLKRHPISKLEKTENRSRSMGRVFPYKSDDEETELYDVNEIISEKQQRKRSKKDDDMSQKRDDEGVEDKEMKNFDIKEEAVESDLEMSVENDPDEKSISALIPEVVDSPPQLTPFWDPDGEKMKYEAQNEECVDDVITSDIQTPKKEHKMAFEDYPLLKQAISSGAMTIMCVNPSPSELKLPNTITSNLPEYAEKGIPNAKEICSSKSTKSPNFSNKIFTQHWRCEPGNDGLKIKLIQPKKINQNPLSIPTPVSISVNVLQHKEHNSPPATSDYHILPDVKAQYSVKKGPLPCAEKSSPSCVEKSSPSCVEKGPSPCVEKGAPPCVEKASEAEENTQKPNESSTKENASEEAPAVTNIKVKRANHSKESWAVPVSNLWQQHEFNFEAECAYNEKLASIPPHCAICVIFTPMYNKNSFPSEPSDVPSNSVVRMPAFCYGNALNSECLIDTSSLLRRDGTAPLLICSKCKVCVHATCYGISMLPIGEWMCTRCSKQAINSECCLCVMRGGALKPTSDGRWAHVICAILIPETYFENTFTKQPVNVSKISTERQKLKCKYCLKPSSRKDLKGVCVQCLSGRCYLPYHVTCGYMAGVMFEANNWPEPIHMICTKHAAARRRPSKRELTNVTIGEKVIAKHRNKRYYWANVKNKYRKDYYSILFEDNSHSSNTLPEDIVSRNVELQGPPQINEKVQVKWTDDKIYNGIFKGSQSIELYVIEFDDESIMHQERKQIYAADEELPKEVQSRLSHSSERRAHDFEAETTDGKRIRITNHKYS